MVNREQKIMPANEQALVMLSRAVLEGVTAGRWTLPNLQSLVLEG